MASISQGVQRIIAIIVLLPTVYATISLTIHLRQASHKGGTPELDKLANRIAAGAQASGWLGVLFVVFGLLYEIPNIANTTGCAVLFRFFFFLYAAHKMGLYWFIYYRLQTFEDFLGECSSKAIYYGGRIVGVIFVIYSIVSLILWDANFVLVSNVCDISNFTTARSILVAGGLQVLADLTVCLSGVTFFGYIFFCGPLKSVRENDPAIAESATRIVIYSVIAFISTTLTIPLSLVGLNFMTSVDVAINVICIALQYPKCMTVLLKFIFSSKSDKHSENVAMIQETNSGNGKQQGDETA